MAGSGYAYVVFTPCQQSHPFEDRRIPFNEDQIKIGRAVAKLKPSSNNAIFDCKVLSRNHAVIWFEDGKFYLKDTKSSNGTFVNNERLSKGTEESPPKEIFSGDIVQFGVEIVESTKKVTHGCIISIARLYYPDGQEASPRSDCVTVYSALLPSTAVDSCSLTSAIVTAINSQELYQLQQYIKEAVYREQLLETKLATLQTILNATQEASENSWRALIDEDRLLSRIEMLEGQLLVYSKNMTDEKLKEQILQLHEEKERYESSVKEALRRSLEEKMEAVQRLFDVERSLETTEEECTHLRESCTLAKDEIKILLDYNADVSQRVTRIAQQLEEAKREYKDMQAQQQLVTTTELTVEPATHRETSSHNSASHNVTSYHQVNGLDSEDKALSRLQKEEETQFDAQELATTYSVTDDDDSLTMHRRTNLIEDKLKEQIRQLKMEKDLCELQGQEHTKKITSEKLECMKEIFELKQSLNSTEEECVHLRESCSSANRDIQLLREQHLEALNRIKSMSVQLENAEQKCKFLDENYANEKAYSESRLVHTTATNSQETVRKIKFDQTLNGIAGCSKFRSDHDADRPGYDEYDDDGRDHDHNFTWEDVMLQATTVTICSAIPLFVLLIAFVLAFFPFLSRFTATREDVD